LSTLSQLVTSLNETKHSRRGAGSPGCSVPTTALTFGGDERLMHGKLSFQESVQPNHQAEIYRTVTRKTWRLMSVRLLITILDKFEDVQADLPA
jgi:hypothetical protein